MNSWCQNNNSLISTKLVWTILLWKYSLVVQWLFFLKHVLSRGDRHHFHFSSFDWVMDYFTVKINVFCRFEFLLDQIYLLLLLLVAEWIWECKVGHLIRSIIENVRKKHCEYIFIFALNGVAALSWNPLPFLLSVRQNAKNRLETVLVKFWLITQIFECKCQLFSERNASDRKIKPCSASNFTWRIRSSIWRDPQIEFVSI